MYHLKLIVFSLLLTLLLGWSGQAAAATLTVTTTADSGTGSLRQAMLDSANGDTINFDVALTGKDLKHFSALPSINHQLIFDGSNRDISISGGTNVRSGFEIEADGLVTISSLTFYDGLATRGGAFNNAGQLGLSDVTLRNNVATGAGSRGGAIYSSGNLVVVSSTLEDNIASDGGAIYSSGDFAMQGGGVHRNSATIGAGILATSGLAQLGGITFTDNIASDAGGALAINTELTCIDCSFVDNGASSAGGTIFIDGSGDVLLKDSSLSGSSAENGAGIFNVGTLTLDKSNLDDMSASTAGGGIYNLGSLTLGRSTIMGSSASTGTGGAIFNSGSSAITTINSSTLQANNARFGGAIFNVSGTVILDNSVLTNSSASVEGGGIFNAGQATLANSLLHDLNAVTGAAIYNDSSGGLTINNSTLSGNSATGSGGGMYNDGSITANQITLANNAATTGGNWLESGISDINNSLLGDSAGGGDCVLSGGSFTALHTLVEDAGCNALSNPAANNRAGDALLQALFNNGGSTLTHELAATSIAVGGGDSLSCLSTDQRNMLRHGSCDMGAYEISDGICASWDGTTERISLDGQAAGFGVAAQGTTGFVVKLAGTCNGALIGVGGDMVSLWVPVDGTIEGGHNPLRWSASANAVTQPTVIDALQQGSVVHINSDASISLENLTLQRGSALDGGGITQDGGGGLALRNVRMLYNEATNLGGAISSKGAGTISITGSQFEGNSAASGGALYANGGGILLISGSTMQGNSATGSGGGLNARGRFVQLLSSTLVGNTTGGEGGGAVLSGASNLVMINSTVSGNSAENGGGLYITQANDISIVNSTIANNRGFAGTAGLAFSSSVAGGTARLANTLIADSLDDADCATDGSITLTVVDSLVEDGSCIAPGAAGNIDGDPQLLPLADNGGATWTHAIVVNSLVHNAGNSIDCPSADQRGVLRDAGACDIGAFELATVPTAVTLRTQQTVTSEQLIGFAGLLMAILTTVIFRKSTRVRRLR